MQRVRHLAELQGRKNSRTYQAHRSDNRLASRGLAYRTEQGDCGMSAMTHHTPLFHGHLSPDSLPAQSRTAACQVRSHNSAAICKPFIRKGKDMILRLTGAIQASQNENAQTPLQEGPGITHDGGTIRVRLSSPPNDTRRPFLIQKRISMKVQLYTLNDLARSKGARRSTNCVATATGYPPPASSPLADKAPFFGHPNDWNPGAFPCPQRPPPKLI